MSESYDYEPASYWQGHDFGQARQQYQQQADRGYAKAVDDGKKDWDLLPECIETNSG